MAVLIIIEEERRALVRDFIGFDPDWNEILVPYDRQAVAELEAMGYEILYTSDDI